MRNSKYFKLPNNDGLSFIGKSASTTLAHAITLAHNPERLNAWSGKQPVDGQAGFNQALAVSIPLVDITNIVLVVRDPIDRFRSACTQDNITDVGTKLDQLESGKVEGQRTPFGFHFRKTSSYLAPERTHKLYKMNDLEALANDYGLAYPLPSNNVSPPADNPTLTADQEARVLAIYADDLALYDSISAPGMTHQEPAEVPSPTIPNQITRPQLLDTLTDAQEASVDAVVNGLPDSTDDEIAAKRSIRIWWREAYYFELSNPRIQAVGAILGWDLNSIWLAASQK